MPDPLNLVDRTVPAMNALAATMSGKDAQHAFAAFTAELAKARTPFYAAPDGEDGFVVAVPMERRQALVDTLGLAAQARFEASRDGGKCLRADQRIRGLEGETPRSSSSATPSKTWIKRPRTRSSTWFFRTAARDVLRKIIDQLQADLEGWLEFPQRAEAVSWLPQYGKAPDRHDQRLHNCKVA